MFGTSLMLFFCLVPVLSRSNWSLLLLSIWSRGSSSSVSNCRICFKVRICHSIIDVCLCCCRTNWCILMRSSSLLLLILFGLWQMARGDVYQRDQVNWSSLYPFCKEGVDLSAYQE